MRRPSRESDPKVGYSSSGFMAPPEGDICQTRWEPVGLELKMMRSPFGDHMTPSIQCFAGTSTRAGPPYAGTLSISEIAALVLLIKATVF